MPLSNVRVIGHYMGGGFGSKGELSKHTVIAALLARRTGRPAKLFLRREESFLLRVKNVPAFSQTRGNRPYTTTGLKRCLLDGAQAFGWKEARNQPRHPAIKDRDRALAQGAASAASPQLRNQGTLGGNLCQRPRCWYFRGCAREERSASHCTVLFDGVPRYACMTLALEAEGHEITTIQDVMNGEKLGLVQQAFVEEDALQCGYCTPGQVMALEGLLRKVPTPTLERFGLPGTPEFRGFEVDLTCRFRVFSPPSSRPRSR